MGQYIKIYVDIQAHNPRTPQISLATTYSSTVQRIITVKEWEKEFKLFTNAKVEDNRWSYELE